MKVLLLSVFHPELVRGGAQQICYELFEGLKQVEGVEPVLLAAIEPSFSALYKSGARITGFDGRDGEFLFLSQDYDYWWHRNLNPILTESFVEFLRLIEPDVVHFHHFMLFGVDFVTLVRRTLPQARIVFTFHEFLSICAADGQLVRKCDASPCQRASSVRCHQCYPEHGPEQFFLRDRWMKRHLSAADAFTTPSHFMIDHFVRWGLDAPRMHHVTNGQQDYAAGHPLPARSSHNRFGFFGQMVDNKGVWVLLRAVALLRSEGFTDFVVELNGDNRQYASDAKRAEIDDFLAAEQARPFDQQIVFANGAYHIDQLADRMARVDWCVVPSVWPEAFGLVISEAWMFKRPVICSNLGAMAERVEDGRNGLNFAVADPRSLADVIRQAATEDGLWEELAAGIQPPPTRDTMVTGYIEVYRSDGSSARDRLRDMRNERDVG